MNLPGRDTHELRPYDPANERTLVCVGCGAEIRVCGHVRDLDEHAYQGVFCCRVTDSDWTDPRALKLRAAIDQARQTQRKEPAA